MAENTTGRHLLAEKDFVQVVTEDGTALPSVPKHWGSDQLPAGAEKKTSRSTSTRASSTSGSSTPQTPPDPNAEPAGNASTEAWAEYAVKVKGAKPEDLVDDQGEPLGRDELRAKYGTPSGS
ncbi:hypothetical protein [Nocardioides sp. SYSU DS0663]|uniref:hypothetical protein n=1 Tax=Nocardioides sp. SYSU DS0663 TaxID=3416445 RepID=UPI003F4C6635